MVLDNSPLSYSAWCLLWNDLHAILLRQAGTRMGTSSFLPARHSPRRPPLANLHRLHHRHHRRCHRLGGTVHPLLSNLWEIMLPSIPLVEPTSLLYLV